MNSKTSYQGNIFNVSLYSKSQGLNSESDSSFESPPKGDAPHKHDGDEEEEEEEEEIQSIPPTRSTSSQALAPPPSIQRSQSTTSIASQVSFIGGSTRAEDEKRAKFDE
ncbi:hypothetical protein BDN70DRAFT_900873 [Pholiota conissans]|uniref:Uncharacterized protein n=1 Tax=Pholiota conissans TaxID=109636 RepID=A0A9P5YLJ1_9AGAR|nr:hypothetical protein BDN70DRAFT_900873 [Pholiota conissans]